MICPICKEEIQPTDVFCPSCGFEIHILPTSASDAVKDYEKRRADVFLEKSWNELINCRTETQRLETISKEIQQKLDIKQKELDVSMKNMSDKLLENSQLKNQLKEREEEINECRREMESLHLKKTLDDLVGIVGIKYKPTDFLQYIPVFRGINIYGGLTEFENQNYHYHKIKIPIRGSILPPKIFSVEIDKQIIIKPLDNVSLFCDGSMIPQNGIAVSSQKGLFFNDNTIEIHISYYK